jgi:hypothetical protein
MGWFLRKAFRVGPLRLNLSKRGIGASVGVKGARLGVDAAGRPYAAGGRYGLYFRERLGAASERTTGSEMTPGDTGQHSDRRGRPWWVLVLLALAIGIVLGVVMARAEERSPVDLFDAQGRRTARATPWWIGTPGASISTTRRAAAPGTAGSMRPAESSGSGPMARQGETALPVARKTDRSR